MLLSQCVLLAILSVSCMHETLMRENICLLYQQVSFFSNNSNYKTDCSFVCVFVIREDFEFKLVFKLMNKLIIIRLTFILNFLYYSASLCFFPTTTDHLKHTPVWLHTFSASYVLSCRLKTFHAHQWKQ